LQPPCQPQKPFNLSKLKKRTAGAGRQIQAPETINSAKVSALDRRWKDSVNHRNLTLPSKHAIGAETPEIQQRKHRGRTKKRMAMAAKAKAQADAQADEPEEGGEEKVSAKSKGFLSLKMIIIAGLALVVLGGGGYGGYMMLQHGKEGGPASVMAKPAAFFDVPEVLVNLSTPAGERTQYLKVKIVLELPDSSMQPQIQTTLPRVMDTFQTFLRELRPTDLDGSAGLYRLKEELTRRVNLAVAPNRINAVLFKEIVVQ
jgi:flagellar FliL protein